MWINQCVQMGSVGANAVYIPVSNHAMILSIDHRDCRVIALLYGKCTGNGH